MKTIEERAKQYADYQCRCYKCDGIDNFTKKSCKDSLNNGCQEHRWKEQGYIQGAVEQQQIDIDIFRRWLSINLVCKNPKMTISDCDIFLKEFRKYMEEQV